MPVYGNAWDRVKRIIGGAIDWLAGMFTTGNDTDDPDDPPTTKE